VAVNTKCRAGVVLWLVLICNQLVSPELLVCVWELIFKSVFSVFEL
jgi:hypothetical protein